MPAPTLHDDRGFEVYGMAPSSSGGFTVGEILNIVEQEPVGETTALLHRYLEAPSRTPTVASTSVLAVAVVLASLPSRRQRSTSRAVLVASGIVEIAVAESRPHRGRI